MTNDGKTPNETSIAPHDGTEHLYTHLEVSNRVYAEVAYSIKKYPNVKVLSDQNALLNKHVDMLLAINTEDAPPWARTTMAKRWHQIAAIAQRAIFENELMFDRDAPMTIERQ